MEKTKIGILSSLVCIHPGGSWLNEKDRIAVKCTMTMKPHKIVEFLIHCKSNRCGRLITILRDISGNIKEVNELTLSDFERRHQKVLKTAWEDSLKYVFFYLKQIKDFPILPGKEGYKMVFKEVLPQELRSMNPNHRMYIDEFDRQIMDDDDKKEIINKGEDNENNHFENNQLFFLSDVAKNIQEIHDL
eukprot:GHVL01026025.1.p1 GENE.GHVL01026025.1~~GHVL01026025.1.p1  ORF type:complete len:189 (+),score=37.87 GHVL01026025.1:480-1046(+)